MLHEIVVVSYVSVLYTRWGPKTPLTDVDTARDCRCVLRQCVVHPVGSEDPPYWRWYCTGLSLCPTSVCCTPGGVRRSPLLTLILHGIVVVSYVSVLYTRWGQKTPLTDVDTARDCRCVLRQRVVHPVGSEDPPYWRWCCTGLSLCPTSACCTPGGIRRPPFLTLNTAWLVVKHYVSMLLSW